MCEVGSNGRVRESQQEKEIFECRKNFAGLISCGWQQEVAKNLGCSVHTIKKFCRDNNRIFSSAEKI